MNYLKKIPLFVFATLLPYNFVESAPLKAEISAKSAILINAETGAVLYEKNPQEPVYPASITKIATALYALEKKGDHLDLPVCASYDAVAAVHSSIRRSPEHKHPPYRLEFGGSHMGIKAGEILPLRTLLYGLMLSSGNDAANVIAQYVSGTVPHFMEELNTFIRSLGCSQTVFYTPHGLPHTEHKTTAFDMAKITQAALKKPLFRQIVKTVKYPRIATNKQPEGELLQHNALVKPGKFYYPKAIGVKTGYTVAGGYTIVAAAEDENRKLIAVLLGCEQIQQRYRDVITLFDLAFDEPKISRTLFSKEFERFTCTLPGGKVPLEAQLSSPLVISYYASEEPTFTTKVAWTPGAFPIRSGDFVGNIEAISSSGQVLASSPLFAMKEVDSTLNFKVNQLWCRSKALLKTYQPLLLAVCGLSVMGITFYQFHHRRKLN